ncbi:hypothetical protein V1511DRAFT_466905, partial [Dipodascopsis uninucleata]
SNENPDNCHRTISDLLIPSRAAARWVCLPNELSSYVSARTPHRSDCVAELFFLSFLFSFFTAVVDILFLYILLCVFD